MTTREVDRSLSPEALAEIERSLRSKLKALALSDYFVDRFAEDAMQKGLLDYVAKTDRGEEITNRNGFVVEAAFRRAIDDLRRESRHADGAVVEALIDSGGVSEPSTDEVAIRFLEAEELRQAVGRLSAEEQQILSLHYFHELTAEASAEKLFVSESTYLRKLKKTLKKLRRLLDGTVPEPGSDLAIEIGVVAWVSLRGAEVVGSSGLLDQLVAAGEGVLDRARDLVGRTGGGGGGGGGTERLVAVLSSGPGKAAACLTVCLIGVGGAEIAGVGFGGGGQDRDRPAVERKEPSPIERQAAAPAVVQAPPVPAPRSAAPAGGGSGSNPRRTEATSSPASKRREAANSAIRSQSPESLVEEAPAQESAPPPVEESSAAPSASSSPNEVVSSQGPEGLVGP